MYLKKCAACLLAPLLPDRLQKYKIARLENWKIEKFKTSFFQFSNLTIFKSYNFPIFPMQLEILTPEKKIFEGDVTIVTFPGANGSFQVMDNHAPLISLLKEGTVEYKGKEGANRINIAGGVVEVLKNRVIVLATGIAA